MLLINNEFFFKNINLLNNSGFKYVFLAVNRLPVSLNNLLLRVKVIGIKK